MGGDSFAPVYYNAKQPTLYALLPWTNPAILTIFKKGEFWFYMAIHILLAGLLIYEWVTMMPVDWKAAGAFQYFTTFFLTFYNANCFSRYEKLYEDCTHVLDAIALFVRELTISFKDEECWKHRLQAAKYLLASADLFFFSITGHALTLKEWEEVVKKGLLTKTEATMLMKYPGPEVVPILTTWSMLVVGDALEKDCFHLKEKVQKIAHMHNRLDILQLRMMQHYRNISETMAFPIPFAYWHLMNLVFALNFLLLALQLAAFQHWMTVIPYAMALMTFMGLREVSNQLADPFGEDIVDFPLGKYLDHVFDHCITLVQSFSSEEAYDRTKAAIRCVRPFDETQMRHKIETDMLVNPGYQAHIDGVYIWERETPLRSAAQLAEAKDLTDRIKESLARFATEEDGEDAQESSADWQRLRNQELSGLCEALEAKIIKYEHETAAAEEAAEAEASASAKDANATSPPANEAPLARPDRERARDKRGKPGYQWGVSGSDAGSDTSRRPRKPHMSTGEGEGTDRAFRLDDVKFTNFDDARRRLQRALADAGRDVGSPLASKQGSRAGSRPNSRPPSKPPSDAGSRQSNRTRDQPKTERSRSKDRNLNSVPEASRV